MKKTIRLLILMLFITLLLPAGLIFGQENNLESSERSQLELISHPGENNYNLNLNSRDECDTLRFPLHGSIVYYTVGPPATGYVCGNNSYGDLVKAEYFDIGKQQQYVEKILFDFAIAIHSSGNSPNITFSIWGGTPGHPPQDVLGSTYLPLTDIVEDVLNEEMTEVVFDPPVEVQNLFFAGVDLPQSIGDTLALWSNSDNNTVPGTAWEKWSSGDWYAMLDGENSWGLNISQAIHPILCTETGMLESIGREINVKAYPNPTTGDLYVSLHEMIGRDVDLAMFNLTGQKMIETKIFDYDGHPIMIDMINFPEGMYILRVVSENKQGVLKVTRK